MSGPEATTRSVVEARLESVRRRIASAGARPDDVTVVVVTKGLGLVAARAAAEAGVVDLGENYANDLIDKATALSRHAELRWHLLGGLQRKSVARLAPYVALYQSVDRIEEGETIARHAPGAAVLVEVDTTGIPGRDGVAPGAVGALVDGLCALGLGVEGLMTVGPPEDPAGARRSFQQLRALVDRLHLAICSMGMSDDFEVAVEEGSTMVRIGRAIFGPRPARDPVSQ